MKRLNKIDDLTALRNRLREEMFNGKQQIKLCCGTACRANGALEVLETLKNAKEKCGSEVEIVATGCQGLCQKGPLASIEPHGYFYQKINAPSAEKMLTNTIQAGRPVRELLYRDSPVAQPIEFAEEVPFYKKQYRLVLRNNSMIDPQNIYQHIANGGYAAVEKVLSTMTPEEVLEEVDRANLRGRGGAGFPAGKKWKHTRSSPGNIKFVVANGDEGDPGAFMDRSIMEGDPHSLLEGMLINAYAIGAVYGFIYVRHEYPLAVENLSIAIAQARELGLLGKNILGTPFNFDIAIREGAGAFVCGESTALVASIEGARGFPRPRPPRLSEPGGGLWGYPTNLNNVETLANVPIIILKGADFFLSIGTKGSPGTKVFALAGKVKNMGLVEVPMGITLRELVYDIGGGIMGDKAFKAIQTGGPSGGCLPASMLDTPVDFDTLTEAGSMMGSGGMVVMDEDTCMVDVAKYFLSFSQSESCGKCPPCRVGTYQMLQILEKITTGKGEPGDIKRLVEMGKLVQQGSLCGLGQTAPNPVLSTLKYFMDEYEEHVYDNYCRAKICTGMGAFVIDQTVCFSCGLCKDVCAFNAVKETRKRYFIDRDNCTKCKACYNICPVDAVKIKKQRHIELEEKFKIKPEAIEIIERRTKMLLRDILESKPPSELVTTTETSSVTEAIKLMAEKEVGSILILDENNKLAGIFTERDVMRCYSKNISFEKESIRNVMNSDVITFSASTDISVAIATMSRKKIRHLPVMEDDKVIGIISYRDLVFYLLPEICYMAEDIYSGY